MVIDYAARLNALRAELNKAGLDGFCVPMADEYQSEYVPASAQRIRFLSGFTGSAGFLVVLKDSAAFFTDGRYTLQAGQQLDTTLFSLHDSGVMTPSEWLAAHLPTEAKLGYDPWLHTNDSVERLTKAVHKSGGQCIAVASNPVDAIWHDRPAPPTAPIESYDLIYAGQNSSDKRAQIASSLAKQNLGATIITDPASIAWLLNIRGGDVPNTPLPLSFAILRSDATVAWFVDPRKITDSLPQHLGPEVDIRNLDQFPAALDELAKRDQPIRVDDSTAASWIIDRLKTTKAKLDHGDDPCELPKACKNATEVDGMRNAHRRDGVALTKFFTWLDQHVTTDTVTEISAEEKLTEFRAANNLYRGPSFDTIAGMGAHGAIVHYRATKTTNRRLELNQIFLLDSGGQYLDGTTDVTRTLAIGAPTAEMRDRFTRVLKGHIALASIRFPEGTTGAELDVLARQYLWQVGLDFNHGTGHGVGSYLGVHEGPQSISRRSRVALKPGMVVSNEPGYYKAGQYGIRIENLQVVVEQNDLVDAERKMLGFETLTLAPIDRRLIEATLLTEPERVWLNAYHARVRETLHPMLDETEATWLDAATKAI